MATAGTAPATSPGYLRRRGRGGLAVRKPVETGLGSKRLDLAWQSLVEALRTCKPPEITWYEAASQGDLRP